MFPLAVRWQVIRNRQRSLSWDSIIERCGCSRAGAMQWWSKFVRGASPWSDPVLENRHIDAARFPAPFLLALEGLVRSHPEIFLREMNSISSRLMALPNFDALWPHSLSSLSRMLNAFSFCVEHVERLAQERCAQAAAAQPAVHQCSRPVHCPCGRDAHRRRGHGASTRLGTNREQV